MFKLLVLLFVIKLYTRNDTFKFEIEFKFEFQSVFESEFELNLSLSLSSKLQLKLCFHFYLNLCFDVNFKSYSWSLTHKLKIKNN